MSDTVLRPAPSAPLLVIVTGPPAAGKTTFAQALAERTGLPLLEKDGIKELDTSNGADPTRVVQSIVAALGSGVR